MKTALAILALMILADTALAGNVWVRGHWRDTDRDGVKDTYVQPHARTTPNRSVYDNYSTKGNYNPYTGEAGTVDPNSGSKSIYQSTPSYNTYQNVYE